MEASLGLTLSRRTGGSKGFAPAHSGSPGIFPACAVVIASHAPRNRSPRASFEAFMQTADRNAKGWALALAALASFTMALDTLVTATSLTTIKESLGASLSELQWTTNAYNHAFAVLLSVAAALGDRLGRRRIFVAGLAVFVLASIVCALSSSIGILIAGRALQGAGAAMVVPMGLAILSVAWPAEERGKALGIFGAVTGLAV